MDVGGRWSRFSEAGAFTDPARLARSYAIPSPWPSWLNLFSAAVERSRLSPSHEAKALLRSLPRSPHKQGSVNGHGLDLIERTIVSSLDRLWDVPEPDVERALAELDAFRVKGQAAGNPRRTSRAHGRRAPAAKPKRARRTRREDDRLAIVAELANHVGEWLVEASFPLRGDDWFETSAMLSKAAGSHSDEAGAGPFGPGARGKPRRDMGWIRKRERDAKAVAKRLLEASRGIQGFSIKALTFDADHRGGLGWTKVAEGRAAVGRWARR